jgi:hypothetical protein
MIKGKSRLWTRNTETKRQDMITVYKRIRNSVGMGMRKAAKEEHYSSSLLTESKKNWNYDNSGKNINSTGDMKNRSTD